LFQKGNKIFLLPFCLGGLNMAGNDWCLQSSMNVTFEYISIEECVVLLNIESYHDVCFA